jgi:predicted dehydrogenase
MLLSRRDFTKLTALGLASVAVPDFAVAAPDADGRKIGYALIGLGRISDHFARGIQETSNSKVTALVSGHPDKAAKWAAQYGVPASSIYTYENMDSIRDNKSVDAVYVGLPNAMHAEYTIRSAKAGKHVLCEKPMSSTVPEAEAMIAACKAANVKLMIAYRCHFEPTHLKCVQLIRDGFIGKVQQIQSTFGFSCDPKDWRVSKPLSGGGPLFDVGIYSLNATRYLTGEEPEHFSASTWSDKTDPRFKDVEENIAWITKFPSGVIATCNTTYGAQMDGQFHVYGSEGWLSIDPAFNYDGVHMRGQSFAHGEYAEIDEATPEKDPAHFVREADHFSKCILNNQTPKTPGEEGLRDMQYIRAIYAAAGITMA